MPETGLWRDKVVSKLDPPYACEEMETDLRYDERMSFPLLKSNNPICPKFDQTI